MAETRTYMKVRFEKEQADIDHFAYHDQNAIMNPNHEKKNTRPYTLTGFRHGIDRALRFTGFTIGALHRVVGSNIVRAI